MERHVKILGVLYVVIGGMGVAAALIVFGVFGGIAGMARAGEHPEAVPFLVLLGGLAMVVVLAMSAPSIIAGIGLLYFKPWARVLKNTLAEPRPAFCGRWPSLCRTQRKRLQGSCAGSPDIT